MLSKLRRLADFTLVELTLLLQLTILSLGLQLTLSAMPLHRITTLLSRAATFPLLGWMPLFHLRCPTNRLSELTKLAAATCRRNGSCLPRSLLLFWLLRARHRPVTLCLGINKHIAGLEGHAWIEVDGIMFGDTGSFINRYTPILRLSA